MDGLMDAWTDERRKLAAEWRQKRKAATATSQPMVQRDKMDWIWP
jgi:hypothetical protein